MRIGVVSLQANSGPFLIEWLAFHRVAGVSDFYLFIDETSDRETVDLAERLNRAGIVKASRAERATIPQGANLQAVYATRGLGIARRDGVEWLAHIDDDEFLEPLGADTLAEKLAAVPPRANAVFVQWKTWGPSEPGAGPVIERTRVRPGGLTREGVKSLVRVAVSEGWRSCGHRPATGPCFFDGRKEVDNFPSIYFPVERENFCLHHFKAKTREEYEQAQRGRKWYGPPEAIDYFRKRDAGAFDYLARLAASDPVRDLWADRWLDRVRLEMNRIAGAIV